jgi:protein O-mannosyl-transferase
VIDPRTKLPQLSLIGFGLALALAWFCYRPALGSSFELDDMQNLAGLARVEDFRTAVDFVLSGTAGPSGRPLALLSFLPQAESWDTTPAAFLRVNILIHLLNAVVLAGCLLQLGKLRRIPAAQAAIVAAIAASAWVLMPLLATSSLLIVQRMTTLSATFVLLGLVSYLAARRGIDERPVRALTGMSASLVIATGLAALCKESGLLLPVLVLVVESTLLERPDAINVRHWRVWKSLFLVLPLLVILVYLASRLPYSESLVQRRNFDAWERLLTEAKILWIYLYKAVLGMPTKLGIYQQAPEALRNPFSAAALISWLSWLALLVAAISWRRRFPLAAFAVLWFFAGHLIESTVVPLELYFEHRNYLPIIGPVFAVSSGLLLGPTGLRRAAVLLVPAYLLLSAYFLHGFASLLGEPSLAARYWALQYPDSVRAVTNMASYQLAEEGPLRALQTIDNFVIRQPQHGYLRIQELNLLCLNSPASDHGQVLDQLERELPVVDFTYTAGNMLSQLFDTAASRRCNSVDTARVAALAEILRSNPRYAGDALYNQFHHKLLAGIFRHRGDHAASIDHVERAIAYYPTSELNMMMVTALGGLGQFDAAQEFIDGALKRGPVNPLKAVKWRHDLEELRAYIQELEASIQ